MGKLDLSIKNLFSQKIFKVFTVKIFIQDFHYICRATLRHYIWMDFLDFRIENPVVKFKKNKFDWRFESGNNWLMSMSATTQLLILTYMHTRVKWHSWHWRNIFLLKQSWPTQIEGTVQKSDKSFKRKKGSRFIFLFVLG